MYSSNLVKGSTTEMALKVYSLLCAVLCLNIHLTFASPSICPILSASFSTLVDQTLDDPNFIVDDPDLTFFTEVLGFKDDTIRHTFFEAIKFYNETFGLDFSSSQPNEQHRLFFENAVMEPRKFRDDIMYRVVFNNWIQTGNTYSSCRVIHVGELGVKFTGNQLLRGSYGGEEGIMAGPENFLGYGFYRIDVCDQSPVIIEFQSASPFRVEPVDGFTTLNFNLYNNILGYGRARGTFTITPDPTNPGKFKLFDQLQFLFP